MDARKGRRNTGQRAGFVDRGGNPTSRNPEDLRRVPARPVTDEHGLTVSEVFGPTVQGEGPHAGQRCGFIRLGLCNLDCAWCDTPYTWDWTRFDRKTELGRRTITSLVEEIRDMNVPRVVISGGEPLVQAKGLHDLLEALTPWDVEIETNGTKPPGILSGMVAQWNVSPKLSSSGVDRERAWVIDSLNALADDCSPAIFKFVAQSVDELDEIEELLKLTTIPRRSVWVMPEGIDVATISRHMGAIADAAILRGFNLTTRLHVIAWGNKRGV
jgi:7-carboxy-7-deazaguanine synthase